MPVTLTAESTQFVSLDALKRHANIDGSSHDDELALFLGAAQEAVEGIIGPVLWRTVTESHAGYGTSVQLRVRPVLSVDVVTVTGGSAVSFAADPLSATLTSRAAVWGPLTVTYTAGRATVPDSVRVATLIIAEHLWSTQRGASPSMILQGDEAVPVPGLAYSIPNRATDLLRPFMLPPAVG